MTNKKHDLAIVIGRFQPFHNGHLQLVKEAAKLADKVLILIGSANAHRNFKNPFDVKQREMLIRIALRSTEFANKVNIDSINDFPYSMADWVDEVTTKTYNHTFKGASKVLVGYNKDSSSFYLRSFPTWNLHLTESFSDGLSATEIREDWINGKVDNTKIDPFVADFLENNHVYNGKHYQQIVEEYKDIQAYKKAWSKAPYPPVFVTTDAVVHCKGKVLMVQRGGNPGKGMWALPGGFIDQDELIEEGILRELFEETKIDVPKRVAKNSLRDIKVYDEPARSLRGRTITHAGYIDLRSETVLPKVVGADDAADAKWINISWIREQVLSNESLIFEDHGHIILDLLQRNNTVR